MESGIYHLAFLHFTFVTWLRRHMPSASVRCAVICCKRYKIAAKSRSHRIANDLLLTAHCVSLRDGRDEDIQLAADSGQLAARIRQNRLFLKMSQIVISSFSIRIQGDDL
jgi:hypothetical protein